MPSKKTSKKLDSESRLYSYDEYQRVFFPKPQPDTQVEEPEAFGVRLAEQVLKRVMEQERQDQE
jgi:hypothetical protein